MKRWNAFFLLRVVGPLVGLPTFMMAQDLRTDVTASNYSPTYYTSVMPRATFKISPLSGYRPSATITIHHAGGNITQFHTNSSGQITDNGATTVSFNGAIGNACTAAGTPNCAGVPISGSTSTSHMATLGDDGVGNFPCSGGIGAVTCNRIFYPGGGPTPQPVPSNNNFDVNFTCSVGPTPTPTPSGTPVARCAWQITGTLRAQCATGSVGTHKIGLKKNGVVVGEQTIAPGYTSGTIDFNGTDDTGTTIQLLIDGVGGEVHTVICYGDPPPGNWWYADMLIPGPCNASPTPQPTSTPGTTPMPSLTPSGSPPKFTPPPGGSPGPTQGPPPGGSPSNVAVSNFNDFYEPVRKAVRDSGNDTAVNVPARVPLPGVTLDDSKMTQVTTELTEGKDKATSIADGVTQATDKASEKLAALNASGIGSDCLISIHTTGFIHDKLGIDTFDIDLCKFSVGIGIFRACMLWGTVCMFFVLTLRTLVYDS